MNGASLEQQIHLLRNRFICDNGLEPNALLIGKKESDILHQQLSQLSTETVIHLTEYIGMKVFYINDNSLKVGLVKEQM